MGQENVSFSQWISSILEMLLDSLTERIWAGMEVIENWHSPCLQGAPQFYCCFCFSFFCCYCLNEDYISFEVEFIYGIIFSLGEGKFFILYSLGLAARAWKLGSVQSFSHVQLFVTPWIAACQASLSITNSWSSLKLTSIESVMPSSHLILCHPLLLLPPISPSIRVFFSESTLHMR